MEKPKIALCGFREWAESIFLEVTTAMDKEFDFIQVVDKSQFESFKDDVTECDLIFFVGWSWIIPEHFVNNNKCICLHPSPLPKYRGGSPIQHQIINGEKESAVTYFLMDKGIDTGPIVYQQSFILSGELSDVFAKIVSIGIVGMKKILNDVIILKQRPFHNSLSLTPQDESQATTYRRRTPDESELEDSDFETAEKAYNKIRSLQDPYPNAYILCDDGKKLLIKGGEIE